MVVKLLGLAKTLSDLSTAAPSNRLSFSDSRASLGVFGDEVCKEPCFLNPLQFFRLVALTHTQIDMMLVF